MLDKDMEEILARHRKEAKDLQGRIVQKKKNATKKTRKGINDECAALEAALQQRHAQELAEGDNIDGDRATSIPDSQIGRVDADNSNTDTQLAGNLAVELDSVSLDATPSQPASSSEQIPRKPNRQKARLARRAAEQQALADSAAEEAKIQPNLREDEIQSMRSEMTKKGLTEKDIQPDGHCLYSAVADQLTELKISLKPKTPQRFSNPELGIGDIPGYQQVRDTATDYISLHRDEFEPFLEEPLDVYVHKIRDTAEWGGQLELLALAKAYGVDIHVLQNGGQVENIKADSEKDSQSIWIAYYRHSYGLGEHYNSLRKVASE
jgi:OTU domain-containing protein 6